MILVTRQEWGAKPPKQTRAWTYGRRGVVLHWTQKPDVASWQGASTMRGIQAFHMRTGFDVFYNFVVDPFGNVYEGRGWSVRGGAQGNYLSDRRDVSISAVYGTGDGPQPPAAQVKAIRELIGEARNTHGFDKTVTGHRDWKPKTCPGPWYYEWIQEEGWKQEALKVWTKPGDPIETNDDAERAWKYMTGQDLETDGWVKSVGWIADALMRQDARLNKLER